MDDKDWDNWSPLQKSYYWFELARALGRAVDRLIADGLTPKSLVELKSAKQAIQAAFTHASDEAKRAVTTPPRIRYATVHEGRVRELHQSADEAIATVRDDKLHAGGLTAWQGTGLEFGKLVPEGSERIDNR